MKKLLLFIVITCMFLLLFTGGTYAGVTGKIQGTVIDSESKEPLPGVNVVLEGTTFGAATDEDGFFFIINVPPGTHVLNSTMVGYAVETASDVRVYVDRTTTQNFALKSAAIAGEEVVVTAGRVPVPLDVSSTEAYVSGEDIVESPATRFDLLMGYQAGIDFVSTGASWSGGGGRDKYGGSYRGFRIRGGDVDETDLQIDGISMMNRGLSKPAIPISRNLIQDVQILTGGFNSEYGNIRSGLVNVVTKDGSYNRYSGVLEGRYSHAARKHYDKDLMSADNWWWELANSEPLSYEGFSDVYKWDPSQTDVLAEQEGKYPNNWEGWNSYADGAEYSAKFYHDRWAWLCRPRDYCENPDVMLDIGTGGPLPLIPNTKYFISGSWNRAEYVLPVALEHSHEYNSSIKITNRIRPNMNIVFQGMLQHVYGVATSQRTYNNPGGIYTTEGSYNTMVSVGDDRNVFGTDNYDHVGRPCYIYTPMQIPVAEERTYNLNVKFTYTYSPSTYLDLSVGSMIYDSDRHPIGYTDPTIIKYIHDDKTGQDIGFDEYPRGFWPADWKVRQMPYNGYRGSYDDLRLFRLWRPPKGTWDIQAFSHTIKGNIVSQVNKYNQIKAGFLLTREHVNQRILQNFGAEYQTPSEAPWTWVMFKGNPLQLDFFVQDKLEWEGMIVNFGVRTLTFFPNKKGFNITPDNIFTHEWNGQAQWGFHEGEGNWQFQNSRTREIKHKALLQPRLGISHPITESSKIFFNYGHFYSQPDYYTLFNAQYSKLLSGFGGAFGTGILGIPDLRWPKLVSYEIGYSQSIYNQILLQISGYYKDYTDNPSAALIMSELGDLDTQIYLNNRYRDIRGLEFRVERNFGRFINGWANYNYMIQSYGDTEFKFLYEDPLMKEKQYFGAGQVKPETLPAFRMSLSLRTPIGWGPGSPILGVKPLAEWRINFLYSWKSGGERLDNPSDPPKEWRYLERVDEHMADLYISKRLARGAQFYVQVYNVFNIKKFRRGSEGAGEGSYYDSLHLPWEMGEQKGNDKYGEWDKPHINKSYWRQLWFFPNKRDIYFGIRYQF